MISKRYLQEFKIEAVKQVTGHEQSVAEVSSRLGTTTHTLYAWIKQCDLDAESYQAKASDQPEINRLPKELKRVTEDEIWQAH